MDYETLFPIESRKDKTHTAKRACKMTIPSRKKCKRKRRECANAGIGGFVSDSEASNQLRWAKTKAKAECEVDLRLRLTNKLVVCGQ